MKLGKLLKVLFVCLTALLITLTLSETMMVDNLAAQATKVFPADKGPKTIDKKILDTYPKGMQEIYYKLFRKRCSKCHTLARPINTTLTPTKWQEYVKRMMNKPGSGIKPAEAREIWKFLVYDTYRRKKSKLDKQLASLPADQRKKEMEIIKKIVQDAKVK